MGFAEMNRIGEKRVVRMDEQGTRVAEKKICDAEGEYRSPFGGGSPIDELWFCANCFARYQLQLKVLPEASE